jgi:hypothetical protein
MAPDAEEVEARPLQKEEPQDSPRPNLEPVLRKTPGVPGVCTIASMSHGQRGRYAGLVIRRQRHGVLRRKRFARCAALAKTASFLGVTGTLQVELGVVHFVAEAFWRAHAGAAIPRPAEPTTFTESLRGDSRDRAR